MNRQYSPEEVSAILKEAAEETHRKPGAARDGGLTLAELQAIGAESDIDAHAIQRAAARLDARSLDPVKRRTLGINVGASHAVRLQRPMTDAEFEALVADCRRVFDARGKVSDHGDYREWRNGNLRIWTEQDPHSGASLLSMQSMQGLMRTMIMGGGISIGWALGLAVMSIFESGGDALALSVTLAFVGAALMATAALATRSWSSMREEQMQELGERAVERQSSGRNVAVRGSEAEPAAAPSLDARIQEGAILDDPGTSDAEQSSGSTRQSRERA